MKRNVLSIALLVVLAGMTVSCQKENLVEPQTSMAEKSAVYTVTYDVDGFQQSVAIHNDTEEQVMMQYFLSIAQVGSSVVFLMKRLIPSQWGQKIRRSTPLPARPMLRFGVSSVFAADIKYRWPTTQRKASMCV